MKKLILLAVTALTLTAGTAYANFQCGIKPLPPLGCEWSDAQCVCSGGHCEWVFICD